MGDVSRVLLLAPDVPPAPGALAAGPGIRYGELAAVLRAAGHEVTLAAPEPGADAVWSAESVASLAAGHDVVILGQGHADLGRAVARSLPHDLPVVVDCYAPGIIEAIALNEDPGMFPGFLARTVELLGRGDLFLVANPAQRLYTLGLLSSAGRLNPTTYADPPLLEVPFGVPAQPPGPVASRVGRGVLVPEDAALVLWYGGVYPWFDCATAVRGFARALEQIPNAWFVIVGGRHPRAHAPDARLLEALAAAQELGIADRVVEAPWGPYDQRIAWYAEADCAICLHHRGLETELSHRTRLVDLLWGRVPVVSSAGDVVGERAAAAGAGRSVPIGDAQAAGDALIELLGSPERRAACRSAAAGLAAELAWPRVLEPLVRWLDDPHVAADRITTSSWREAVRSLVAAARAARATPRSA
jgi:glycosyltransferase involved in cell wall biosynthesis